MPNAASMRLWAMYLASYWSLFRKECGRDLIILPKVNVSSPLNRLSIRPRSALLWAITADLGGPADSRGRKIAFFAVPISLRSALALPVGEASSLRLREFLELLFGHGVHHFA